MRRSLAWAVICLLGAAAAPAVLAAAGEAKPEGEPDRIRVQHILIGFEGSVPGKNITRNREEAKALAHQLLERIGKGESFEDLVKEFSADGFPGIYGLANLGVKPAQGEYPRARMVAAFGDVGFNLKVGEVGLADYDASKSPYGWHIIKRIE